MGPRFYQPLRQLFQRASLRRPFHRTVMTEEQVKTAGLQKTPHTPNQIVTEVPHSKEASLIIDVPSPLWYHRLGPVKNFFSWFSRMQRRSPLRVAIGTSLTTYFLGDVLAQEISGEEYDWTRTARMLLIGGVASVPGYKWFLFLGSHFNYGSAMGSITLKVLIQQMFFAPIFNTYFFGMQAILSGERPSGVIERVRTAVPESIVSSAKFWPAVTALNFTVIPAHLRFAFSGVFAVVWQTYLSFLNRKKEERYMAEVQVGFGGLAEEARGRAGERLEEAGITDLVEDATEKINEVVEDAKEKVTEVMEDAKEKVSEVLGIKEEKEKEGNDEGKQDQKTSEGEHEKEERNS